MYPISNIFEVSEFLLSVGADPNFQFKKIPIITYIFRAHLSDEDFIKLIELFIEHDTDLNSKCFLGKTSVDYALSYKCSSKVIEFLEEKGAKRSSSEWNYYSENFLVKQGLPVIILYKYL